MRCGHSWNYGPWFWAWPWLGRGRLGRPICSREQLQRSSQSQALRFVSGGGPLAFPFELEIINIIISDNVMSHDITRAAVTQFLSCFLFLSPLGMQVITPCKVIS